MFIFLIRFYPFDIERRNSSGIGQMMVQLQSLNLQTFSSTTIDDIF